MSAKIPTVSGNQARRFQEAFEMPAGLPGPIVGLKHMDLPKNANELEQIALAYIFPLKGQ